MTVPAHRLKRGMSIPSGRVSRVTRDRDERVVEVRLVGGRVLVYEWGAEVSVLG